MLYFSNYFLLYPYTYNISVRVYFYLSLHRHIGVRDSTYLTAC